MQRNPLFLKPAWVLEKLLGVSYSLITCNSFFSEKVPILKSKLTYPVQAVNREENTLEAPTWRCPFKSGAGRTCTCTSVDTA